MAAPYLSPLASWLERAGFGALGRRVSVLLRNGLLDDRAASFDANAALLARNFGKVEAAWAALSEEARVALCQYVPDNTPIAQKPDEDFALDRLASMLLAAAGVWSEEVLPLAVALARLVEDMPRLSAGRSIPLGLGFEDMLDERLERRLSLLPTRKELLLLFNHFRQLLMEEPVEGERILAEALGRPLGSTERAWLEVERQVAILRFVRRKKTDSEGHIRWYVHPGPDHRPVLARLGMTGHWLLYGAEPTLLARLGLHIERIAPPEAPADGAWNLVAVRGENRAAGPRSPSRGSLLPNAVFAIPHDVCHAGDPEALSPAIRRALASGAAAEAECDLAGEAFAALQQHTRAEICRDSWSPGELIVREGRLCLLGCREGEAVRTVASIPLDATDDEILYFADVLRRVADVHLPIDRLDEGDERPAVVWARSFLRAHLARDTGRDRFRDLKVRIVYVPSSIPHELGGLPKVGAAFLCDHLERLGADVDFVELPFAQLEDRILELLGADVIGISVYIHNRSEAVQIIRRLREEGFGGKVVLGGPEVRSIDSILESIPGWDAVIRGEAEEVLPAVLDFFQLCAAGESEAALSLARGLRGVALRCGDAVLLCDTAAKNRAESISCPLPYDWRRGSGRRLKMNFTRGCPYLCTFCPNHQGRQYRAGPLEELWSYAVLAVADNLPLPADLEADLAKWIQERLGVAGPLRLRLALDLFLRSGPTKEIFQGFLDILEGRVHPRLREDPAALESSLGIQSSIRESLAQVDGDRVGFWRAKEIWLLAKSLLLASRQIERSEAGPLQPPRSESPGRPPFILETSEDNTLVNRAVISAFLERRELYGLTGDFVFNPGQNTIRDLLRDGHAVDEELIRRLTKQNPFAIAFGADGTSNAILRQNRKPLYGVTGLLAVNRALSRLAFDVANNYILLTPESSLIDAIESFLLFLLLPIRWRDYQSSINLRVIKEETTLATDEGVIFAPQDQGGDVPLRFPEVQQLLDRHSLTSRITGAELRPLLRRMIKEDPEVRALLPWVVERWERNLDDDDELVDLAALVRAERHEGEDLGDVLLRLEEHIQREGFVDGRTIATFHELREALPGA